MKFRWMVEQSLPVLAGELGHALKIGPLMAQCLLNRGLKEPDQIGSFLQPRLKHLSDPFLLPNMAAAVEVLFQIRERGDPLVIFGDYDVDGVTASALLLEVFKALGWRAECFLPHRMEDGYGLSAEAVEKCLQKHPAQLLLAVDCGTNSRSVIQTLRERGVQVIILDHHQPEGGELPDAVLINPHARAGGDGSSVPGHGTELCSVGLAFKLAHALVKQGRQIGIAEANAFDLRLLLDLVALGTIADISPLRGENRILVAAGLERVNRHSRVGITALTRVAGCPPRLGVHEIGFQLAPRLNAAGRLENAQKALQLLIATSMAEALPLAVELDATNRERQKIERETTGEVLKRIEGRFNPKEDFVIVEGNDGWHIGVVGIVAARVLQQFYRPTVIIGGDGGEWRGSGRSIDGFDLAAALRECTDLLLRHGGHAMAAGLSIEGGKVDSFRSRLNEVARKRLTLDALQPQLRLDAEVGLEEISLGCIQALEQLRPAGHGNPTVQLFVRNLNHRKPLQRIGKEKEHVKMWVTDGVTTHEAVWWGAGNGSLPVGNFDLAFVPLANEFNGRRQVQLKVLDWRGAREATLV